MNKLTFSIVDGFLAKDHISEPDARKVARLLVSETLWEKVYESSTQETNLIKGVLSLSLKPAHTPA